MSIMVPFLAGYPGCGAISAAPHPLGHLPYRLTPVIAWGDKIFLFVFRGAKNK